jgi:hypothetical protein
MASTTVKLSSFIVLMTPQASPLSFEVLYL